MIDLTTPRRRVDVEDLYGDDTGTYEIVSKIVGVAASLYHPFNDDDFHDHVNGLDGVHTVRDMCPDVQGVPEDVLGVSLDDVHVDHTVQVVGNGSPDVDGIAFVEIGGQLYTKAIHGYWGTDGWSF